jgi:hypothetical protein
MGVLFVVGVFAAALGVSRLVLSVFVRWWL